MVSQLPSSFRIGEIWSNFLVLVKIRAAKFCRSCSLWTLSFEVPVEPQNNLLKTNEFKIVFKTSLEYGWRTLFSWHTVDKGEELD